MAEIAGRARKVCRVLTPFLALAASACQTLLDASVTNTNSWRAAPPPRLDGRQQPNPQVSGAPLLRDQTVAEPTVVEGTGRFVGDHASASQQNAAQGEEGITLNLINVPVQQAANSILADILGVKYTVDPKIEGRVTIQTPAPVARSAAIDLFQSALRANNAAVISTGGHYRIVPLDQAPVGAVIQTASVPNAAAMLGSSVHVVQLKYVAASEMRRILEPIAPRGAIVRSDDARRTLTLSGTSQDLAGLLEAISIFDVDVMKGMSFALVPVRASDPAVIADELRSVFASEQEGPMAGMVQFLPNKRLGSVLVISPQRAYLTRAAEWVRRLDTQAAGTEKQFYTYAAQNRRAQELVDVLQTMFARDTGGARGGGTRNVAPQYQEASVQPTRTQSAGPQLSGSQSFGSSFGGAGSAGGFSQGSSSSAGSSVGTTQSARSPRAPATGGSVEVGRDEATGEPRIRLAADEAKNTILIEASPADYRRVMRMIGTLDVMANQVLLEATIAEITLGDDLKLGVRWQLQGKKSEFTFSDAANGAVNSVFPGFSYALQASNIAASLNALNQLTNVNIISSPSLTVMDNRTAFLQVGDQVPITTQSAAVLASGAPVINTVSYRDTGVILAVTPRISQSGRVVLDIEQEVSSVVRTTSSDIDSPTIRQRKVRTSVVVSDGDALVLGGLIQDSKTLTRRQVPILGDIPWVGNVFKQKDDEITKTELVIVITPRVLRTVNEARQVTDEFRRELSLSTRPEVREGQRAKQVPRRLFD